MYCGANGHWAAYCERRVATEEAVIKSAEAASGSTCATASCGKEKTAGTNRPCVKSAELDQGKKLIGFGGLFGLKDIYEKDVTSIKQKPQG